MFLTLIELKFIQIFDVKILMNFDRFIDQKNVES